MWGSPHCCGGTWPPRSSARTHPRLRAWRRAVADSKPARPQVGWDIGGAHVKACLLGDGALRDVCQWPCPLWQGMEHLERALDLARARWSVKWEAGMDHAATMTGEMVDLFSDRAQGVA